MVHGLPEGLQFTHLKRATIINLIKEREYLSGKLSRHLDKTTLTYQEAVEAIMAQGDDDPIPKDLGDFILAAISNTIKRPILVVKPTFEKVKDSITLIVSCMVFSLSTFSMKTKRGRSGVT